MLIKRKGKSFPYGCDSSTGNRGVEIEGHTEKLEWEFKIPVFGKSKTRTPA
jgi:hypothetical protein